MMFKLDITPIVPKLSLSPFFQLYTAVLFIVSLWLIGLFLFINQIPTSSSQNNQATDAIVVLTGGIMRLSEGLQFFANVKAKKILISGVGKGFTQKDIIIKLKKMNLIGKINPQDIILGNIASTTQSNALETKIFMTLNNFKSLRLITSNYHMQRSTLLFRKAMPDINIIEHPVFTDNLISDSSHISFNNLKTAASEYNKFLGTTILHVLEKCEQCYDNLVSYLVTLVKHSKIAWASTDILTPHL